MNKKLLKTTSILILTSFIATGNLSAQAQDDKRTSNTDDGRSTRSTSTQRRRSPRLTPEQIERIRQRRSSRGSSSRTSTDRIQSRGDYAGRQRYDRKKRPRYTGEGRGNAVEGVEPQQDNSRGGRGTNVNTEDDRARAKEEAVTRKLDEILKRLDTLERLVRNNGNDSSTRTR